MSDDSGESFWVGDVWFIEATTTSPKTGTPVAPGSVIANVYAPSEWNEELEVPVGTGKPVTLAKIGEGIYENASAVPLPAAGIWRAIAVTTAPNIGIKPGLITVKPIGDL